MEIFLRLLIAAFLIMCFLYHTYLISEIFECEERKIKQLRRNKTTLILNLVLLIPILNASILILAVTIKSLFIMMKPFWLLLTGHCYNTYMFYYIETFTILLGPPDLDYGYDSYKNNNITF